jgi:hypothetical protein
VRYTIRPATILDIYCLSSVAESRFENAPAQETGVRERLIQAWHLSRGVWLAADTRGVPGAIFGATPRPDDPDVGVIWMLFLQSFKAEEDQTVLRLVTDEMLEKYGQIENYLDSRKTWALDLMRSAGFTVDSPIRTTSGDFRCRVWRVSHALRGVAH